MCFSVIFVPYIFAIAATKRSSCLLDRDLMFYFFDCFLEFLFVFASFGKLWRLRLDKRKRNLMKEQLLCWTYWLGCQFHVVCENFRNERQLSKRIPCPSDTKIALIPFTFIFARVIDYRRTKQPHDREKKRSTKQIKTETSPRCSMCRTNCNDQSYNFK